MEWQPISTAPIHTVADMLLWKAGRPPAVGAWVDKAGEWQDIDGYEVIRHPTHWMPLPSPPDQGER